jgi:hypothetical protein
LGFSQFNTWKPNQCLKNIYSYNPNFNFSNKTINLNFKTLNNFNNHLFTSNLSNFNIYTNLQQSKQNRWLLKNSLLSNANNLELFYFTQAKKLIGNTMYNSSVTSQNIWNSSKLTQVSQTSELLQLSLFQNLILGQKFFTNNQQLELTGNTPTGLYNFDLFENSVIWNTKKYFFNNQLKLTTPQTQSYL